MASQPAVQWSEIERILGAQPGAQVPFAQYVVNLGPVQGSAINLAPQGLQAVDQLLPRAGAPRVLPRQVPGFVDRANEQLVVGEALARGQVVDVHGADGTGKTSLVSQVMHLQFPGDYAAGMVYLTVRHDEVEDLLQELVEHFYEARLRHVKVTENEARRLLAGKQALIVLDDADHLAESDADAVIQAAPQAAFIVAGREPRVWQGQALALEGLPLEDALALFERNLGHPLDDEQPVAEAICHALDGVPLSIVKAARTAGLRRVPLAQVLQEVQPGDREARPPVEQLFWMLGQHLSEGERRVLAAIAAPGGPSVSRAALAHISQVAPPKLQEYLARLEKLGLLHVEAAEGEAERYSLDEGLRAYVRRHAVDEDTLARAAAYYLQFSGALRARSRHPDEENVVWALNYYGDRGQWREVLRIVRGMEAYLVTSGRWGQWRKRLENAWRAGSELNDPTTEAWAQNQLGIVALAAGDSRRAAQLFRGALRIWRAVGDRTGAAIARWNLQLLVGPPPPPERGEPEPAPDGGGAAALPIIMGGIAATLLTILVALFWLLNSGAVGPATVVATTPVAALPTGEDDAQRATDLPPIPTTPAQPVATTPLPPEPTTPVPLEPTTPVPPVPTTPVPPIVTTAAPPPEPTTPVPPRIEVWLMEGCDRAYEPGTQVEVRAQSNVAGILDVHLRNPDGRRERLLRVEISAGGVTRGRLTMPDRAGDWRLEAELDGGRATAACAFVVVEEPEPEPPVIEAVQVRPVAEEPICPGDPIWIVAEVSSEAGLRGVAITTRPPGEQESTAEMEAIDDQTYGYQAVAYAEPGLVFLIEAEDVEGRTARTTQMVYTVKPCSEVLYDFVAGAPGATWQGYSPGDEIEQIPPRVYDLGFPGGANDDEGYALWLDGAALEGGGQAEGRVLETHPTWARGGEIRGDYRLLGDQEIIFQAGDRFVARVGLPEETTRGDVTFEVWFWPAGSEFGERLLGTLSDAYDGQVRDWTIALDALAGQRGTMRLAVRAGEDYADDRALWIEARIER